MLQGRSSESQIYISNTLNSCKIFVRSQYENMSTEIIIEFSVLYSNTEMFSN